MFEAITQNISQIIFFLISAIGLILAAYGLYTFIKKWLKNNPNASELKYLEMWETAQNNCDPDLFEKEFWKRPNSESDGTRKGFIYGLNKYYSVSSRQMMDLVAYKKNKVTKVNPFTWFQKPVFALIEPGKRSDFYSGARVYWDVGGTKKDGFFEFDANFDSYKPSDAIVDTAKEVDMKQSHLILKRWSDHVYEASEGNPEVQKIQKIQQDVPVKQ
jgi:hypothetical protein